MDGGVQSAAGDACLLRLDFFLLNSAFFSGLRGFSGLANAERRPPGHNSEAAEPAVRGSL